MKPVFCDYCDQKAKLKSGAELYAHRPDLGGKWFWVCTPCEAWVGCHLGTERPLGRLANAELRKAKTMAHAIFDPLWQAKMRRDNCTKHEARGAAYKWLAGQLGIDVDDCHIGEFDLETCRAVIEICGKIMDRGEAA